MLYEIFFPLREIFFGFNIFKYVTFRTIGATLTGFFLTVIVMPYFINWSKRVGISQNERKFGVESHLKKSGTPTMGGVVFLSSAFLATILWSKVNNIYIWIVLFVMVSFGVIGFLDDFLKKTRKSYKGLSILQKYSMQLLVSLVSIAMLYFLTGARDYFDKLYIPYTNELVLTLPIWLAVIFYVIVITGSSNAINLTDGVDGLAGGLSVIAFSVFGVFTYLTGNIVTSSYLRIPYVEGVSELTILVGALVGSIGGFLWFNAHPAKIFMGDVGALSLGATIGVISIIVKQELLLVVVGAIFVAETLSVALQIVYFKITKGKRIFKMSPLHHHFELSGWSESQVVIRFWILGVMFALIALASLKIR